MLTFLRCVGEAVVAQGMRGLMGLVPFGEQIYDVAANAIERYRELRREQRLAADLQTTFTRWESSATNCCWATSAPSDRRASGASGSPSADWPKACSICSKAAGTMTRTNGRRTRWLWRMHSSHAHRQRRRLHRGPLGLHQHRRSLDRWLPRHRFRRCRRTR
jgi:hypothetical protein